MRSDIANWFGVAGGTIAALTIGATGLTAVLPYRLSPSQTALLDVVLVIQFAGPVLAITFGILALRGDARSRRRGVIAIAFSVVAVVLFIYISHMHSTSRW